MTPRSLSELLETYQAWSSRRSLEDLAGAASERGDSDTAAVFRRMLDDEQAVTPLDALTAQRELSDLLRGWEWQTVRAARDAGAGWDEIGRITETDARTAQETYGATVARQAAMSAEYGWEFDAGYHAAVVEAVDARPADGSTFGPEPAGDTFPPWDAVDDSPAPAAESGEEPIPFLLTSQGYGATRPDIAPPDERGLTGGEGAHLSSGPTLSAEGAAHALAEDGRSLDDARSAVRAYQDSATSRLGTPVHAWGLDRADLDEIRTGAAAAPVIPLPRPSAAAEGARRAELAAWHASDVQDTAVDPLNCIERTDHL